ncbi:hypothetical protein JW835_03410 [bacterium]|nr:hypothetical protein [bacterium]
MKRGFHIGTCFIILAVFLHARVPAYNPLHRKLVRITRGDSLLGLPDRFIIPSTFVITTNETLLDSSLYMLNPLTGTVRWIHVPDSGTVVNIKYQRMPVSLPLTHRHFSLSDSVKIQISDSAEAAHVYQFESGSRERLSNDGLSDLRRSGSIFRGVTVGTNQGMRLQSGLRLQISGQIAPGVDVTASLTDQNTPIQPEGNTQTLQEIDKVFVNIKASSLKATLGDFVFDTGPSGFGTYSRKLQGVMGSAEGKFGNVTLIGAASKGQFTTNHFQGQESNQGPYQLTGTQGQQDIIVLAGTERVWIDGERMVRGEDNDYVIEYGTGQITFTRNRLITSDSRITVDFEYSDLQFQKSIYGAVGEITLWDERIQFRSTFLHESDDKENPLDIPLTDDYKQILEQAGDDPDSAAASGARFVGEGKGNYRLTEQDGISYYQYMGSGEGDTVVRFSYVGEGEGDYSFQGYDIYQFEGQNRGSYIPAIALPMARKHQVASLQSDLKIMRRVSVSGEMSLSNQDLNLYSRKDDDDNTDRAFQGEVRMNGHSLQFGKINLGQLEMSGRIRDVGGGYRSVGRMTDVEYGRKWGTEEGVFWGERVWEAGGIYSPIESWKIGGEAGNFHRGDFQSERKTLHTDFHQGFWPHMKYQAEWINSENGGSGINRWKRQKGQIIYTLGAFTPSVRYEGEHRRQEDPDSVLIGFRFDDWTGRLEFRRGIISGFAEETMRSYQRYRSGHLKHESKARTDKIQWALKPGTYFSATMMYTRRDRNYEDPASEDQRADLADVNLRFGPRSRWIDAQLNYQFSSTRISELVRDTIQVMTGLGNYRFDEALQELVPDADGDLLIRMVQTGRFTPVNDLKAGADFRWNGSALWKAPSGWQSFVSVLKGRTLFRVERRDSERDFAKVNRTALSPDWGKDSTLVMAMTAFHQDVEIVPEKRRVSIRLRYKNNNSENNQLLRENLVRHVTERAVRVKGKFSESTGIQIEYINKLDEKNYTARSYSNRDIRLHDWSAEASYRPKQHIEIALKGHMKAAEDRAPDPITKASSVFIIPRISYAIRGRGNVRAELEIGRVFAKPKDRALPYEMLNGDQPGRTLRWNVLMTYRLSGHMMATLNYRARQEPWRENLYQTGQVEVRAFF